MASAPSGRYQSKLFNFVHQQSRRLTEQCDRAFRNLQVTTSWGVQVLLYPVYLLFQSTGLAGKLHSSVQENWPQLQADDTDSQPQSTPTVDTPIQRVLLLVDVPSEEAVSSPSQKGSLAEEEFSRQLPPEPTNFLAFLASWRFKIAPTPQRSISQSTDTPRRNRPVVQGIATQLSSRTLVLVTAQNEILDILTAQQQEKLQKRIIGEVANYWHYQRLALSPPAPPAPPASPAPPALFPYQALAFLDRTAAQMESNSLAPVSEVAITLGKRSWEIVQMVQTQLSVLLSGRPQPAGSKSPAIAPNGIDAHTLRIQALIWAAIDYFFGRRSGNLGQTTPTTDSLELPAGSKPQPKPLPHRRSTSKLPSAQLTSVDPWLTLSDLFGDPTTESGDDSIYYKPESSMSQTTTQQAGKTNLALPSSQPGGYSLLNLINSFRKVFGLGFQTFLPASGLVKQHGSLEKEEFSRQLPQESTRSLAQRKTAQKIVIAGAQPGAIASPTPGASASISTPSPESQPQSVSTGESNQQGGQSTQIHPAPDWIETQATAMGYVKHPLEQLLEWLDRAMLWLEEVLMSVLQWIQYILRGK